MAAVGTENNNSLVAAQHFITCDECESRPAVHYCQMCPGNLCNECKEKHTKTKLFKSHVIISISEARKSLQTVTRVKNDPVLTLTVTTELSEHDCISCRNQTSAILSGSDNNILEIDISNKDISQISLKLSVEVPSTIAFAHDDCILYADQINRLVKVRNTSGIEEVFCETDWNPQAVSVSESGDVLVGVVYGSKKSFIKAFFTRDKKRVTFKGKVIRYNPLGQKTREIENDDGKQLYSCPYYVKENSVNKDVIVSDDTSRVVVVNGLGKLRFEYKGCDPSGFWPLQLDTDCLGNIVICDAYGSIHLITKDGSFMRLLLTGMEQVECPSAVAFDGKDSLWVAESYSKKVKIFKYLE